MVIETYIDKNGYKQFRYTKEYMKLLKKTLKEGSSWYGGNSKKGKTGV